ncbi:MAG: AI-2E family transporter [Planctomycetota bacterium]
MERTEKYPRLVTLIASVVVIAALYLARGVLIPFALAMLVSFLLAPLVLRLQRWHFSRSMAVTTVVLLVLVGTAATSWLVAIQVQDVTTNLSGYRQNIRDKMGTLRGMVAQPVQDATKIVEDLGAELEAKAEPDSVVPSIPTVRLAEPEARPFEALRKTLGPALEALTTAAMALLFAFVMLLRQDDLGDRFIRLVGHGRILVTTRALEEAARRVSSYLWRHLLLNGVHGLAIGIGLALIGVPNAMLWGLMSAILRFIPYIGPWVAAAFPVLTALAVFPGWPQPLLTLALFLTLELISNNLLEPWVYGRGTGLSSLAIVVSALFWTWIWGPVGLILSTPLTVCLVVMGKYVPQLRFLQLLFGDAPGLTPPARLYQRLVSGDQDQAWLVVQAESKGLALHELYDLVVLPALSMAERDRQRGAIDGDVEARIEETMKLLLEEAAELGSGPAVITESGVEPVVADSTRVLCLPARGSADALAATMLRQVLERDGTQVEVSSTAELSAETLDRIESQRVDVVCISSVPPSGFMHVRYLCKRIAGRFPKLPIVVGLWTPDAEVDETPERPPIVPDVHVVASLGEARMQVRQLAESARLQREAGVPVGPAPATESSQMVGQASGR